MVILRHIFLVNLVCILVMPMSSRHFIFIITKDNNRYHFGDWGYQIKNDTLYGKGLKVNPNGEEPFDGKIAMDDISHFEVEEAEPLATIGVAIGVAAFVTIVLGANALNSASNDVKSCSQN